MTLVSFALGRTLLLGTYTMIGGVDLRLTIINYGKKMVRKSHY